MSNNYNRKLRRRMEGKTGHSPAKSRRRQRQRQRAAMQMQATLQQMREATKPLVESVAKALNEKKEDSHEEGADDGVGSEEEGSSVD